MPGIEDALAGAGDNPEWLELDRFFGKKERHYAKTYLEEQAKYEAFHNQTCNAIHAVTIQHAACEKRAERMSVLLAAVDTDIREKVGRLRHERHVVETDLEKICEEKVVDVRGLMIEEKKSRNLGDSYTAEVTNEICHLYNDLEQAKNYRLQKSEKLQEVVSQKLEEIQVAISAESKIREESTHTILELFGQMGNKMQKEIDVVKQERKESTDRLISLMEVVLPHLGQARLNHVKLVNEKLEDQKAAAKIAEDVLGKKIRRQKTQRLQTQSAITKPSGDDSQMSMEALKRVLPVIQGANAFASAGKDAKAK